MTTQEKIELREKYFTAHWAQKVACNHLWNVHIPLGRVCDPLIYSENTYLVLTPISEITDEDAKIVSDILGIQCSQQEDSACFDLEGFACYLQECIDGTEFLGRKCNSYAYAVDILRSKGYALPFMNYSVDRLIEMGFLKLRTK